MSDQSDATQADADAQSQVDEESADSQVDESKTISIEEARKLRSEAANLRKRLKDSEAKAMAAEAKDRQTTEAKAKEDGRYKELVEAREKELEETRKQLADRDLNDLKRKIASEEGLPSDLALRIAGDSEDDLRDDAKSLAKHLKAKDAPDNDAGERTKPGTKKPEKKEFADPAKWGLPKR